METILKLLHQQRPNPNILATSHTLKLTWTWLISLPPAKVTLGVQQPMSQEEKRHARVSLWVPKTPATSHHHHNRERRPQPHHCKKRLPTKQLQPRAAVWMEGKCGYAAVSRRRVINYVAKYATKSEPHSKSLKTVYSTIMKSLKDDDKSLKVVQKILINSVGETDYSVQETCHLLLQLPMYMHHETLSF